jgi:hypothetical protein
VSHSQAGPPKIESQLLGGVPSGLASAQTYQSALSLTLLDRLSRNQACWSDVCEMTWSMMTLMPRACAAAMKASKSSRVPKIGSTSQ